MFRYSRFYFFCGDVKDAVVHPFSWLLDLLIDAIDWLAFPPRKFNRPTPKSRYFFSRFVLGAMMLGLLLAGGVEILNAPLKPGVPESARWLVMGQVAVTAIGCVLFMAYGQLRYHDKSNWNPPLRSPAQA